MTSEQGEPISPARDLVHMQASLSSSTENACHRACPATATDDRGYWWPQTETTRRATVRRSHEVRGYTEMRSQGQEGTLTQSQQEGHAEVNHGVREDTRSQSQQGGHADVKSQGWKDTLR